MNAKMPALKRAFEAAGFRDVETVLGSGNVIFSAPAARAAVLERTAESAMGKRLEKAFPTFVRPIEALERMLAADPFRRHRLSRRAKRVVTFLRGRPGSLPELPLEVDGARILRVEGAAAFAAYVPSRRGPVFMTLIQRTFGTDNTTRTWETVRKVVAAAGDVRRDRGA